MNSNQPPAARADGPAPPREWKPRSIQQLRDTLHMLCHYIWHRELRDGDHIWSIPVDKERDFDCIISDGIDELEASRAALTAALAEVATLKDENRKNYEREKAAGLDRQTRQRGGGITGERGTPDADTTRVAAGTKRPVDEPHENHSPDGDGQAGMISLSPALPQAGPQSLSALRDQEARMQAGSNPADSLTLQQLRAEVVTLKQENKRLTRIAKNCGSEADHWALKYRELKEKNLKLIEANEDLKDHVTSLTERITG